MPRATAANRLARRLVEAAPSVRWHAARIRNPVYRLAFASVGPRTVIVRPRILRGVARITIGADCAIHDGAWIQAEGEHGAVDIGDRVYLGHDVHVHSIDPVRIGSGCVLADRVFIASTDHARDDRHAAVGTGAIEIGDDVFLGQGAVVLGGVTIGSGATVGAGAVVTRSVPAGTTVVGVPARELPGDP
jgi:acetyltransferase-like isoleucine patch superfamily enzyme